MLLFLFMLTWCDHIRVGMHRRHMDYIYFPNLSLPCWIPNCYDFYCLVLIVLNQKEFTITGNPELEELLKTHLESWLLHGGFWDDQWTFIHKKSSWYCEGMCCSSQLLEQNRCHKCFDFSLHSIKLCWYNHCFSWHTARRVEENCSTWYELIRYEAAVQRKINTCFNSCTKWRLKILKNFYVSPWGVDMASKCCKQRTTALRTEKHQHILNKLQQKNQINPNNRKF